MSFGVRRRRQAVQIATAVIVLIVVGPGCAASGSDRPGGAPANQPFDGTVVATDLAPSQIDVSTVPPPTLVPPCTSEAVDVVAGDRVDGVDQVVDLINRGSARCDVDISGTANASADIEPSVVLGPGEIGHVWVSDRGGCDRTTADPQVGFDVVVNGVVYPMVTTFVAYCGVQLWAFFTD